MRRLSIMALLLTACASALPPATPPAAVPPTALEAMCARIRDEGIGRETVVNVVSTTRPLLTRASLQAMLEAAYYKGRVDPAAIDAAYEANKAVLPLPAGAGCAWRTVDAAAGPAGDAMTLELSPPFLAPFARRAPGLLARLSLGGEAATWYWIPLRNQNGTWMAATATPLALRE